MGINLKSLPKLREYFTAAVPTEGVIQVLCMFWIGKYGKTVHCLHYNLATRVYKQVFSAIVQMQTKNITNNYDSVDGVLKQNPIKFRKKTLLTLLKLSEFKMLEKQIVN